MIAALLAMLGPFTIDTYLPSFPDIEATFHIERAILAQSLGVYLAAFAISTLFWGPLADRIGRRSVIVISVSLYIIASIGCALAESIHSLLFLRVIQGLAASGGLIAGRAMIRDAHDARTAQQAMAQVMLLFALAPAVAPMLGGWLQLHFGWRSIFWFLTLFGGLVLLFTLWIQETLVAEKRQSIQPRHVMRTYIKTVTHAHFPALTLSLSFVFAGLFLYIAGAPTVIYDFLELGPKDFPFQFIPMVAGMMLGAWAANRLAHRWTTTRLVVTGFAMTGAAALFNIMQSAIVSPPQLFYMIAPLPIYCFGLAMLMPTLTVLSLDCFPQHRGTAASMQGFIQMLISAAVASLAVPLLHSHAVDFALGQAFFLSMGVMLWLYHKRQVHAQ